MKCCMCSKGAAFGNKCCLECLEKGRIRSAKRYEVLRQDKICKICNEKHESKGILCEKCKLYRKNRFAQRKKDKICVTCGVNSAINGLKCEKCYVSYKNGVNLEKQRRLSEGRCAYCEEKRVHTQLCKKHYLQNTSRTHLGTMKRYKEFELLFERQNGKCPYSNINLTLGIDASIDHIYPKCLGGSKEMDNLQWVYTPINFMKSDQTEKEFLKLVKSIYENKKLNEVDF